MNSISSEFNKNSYKSGWVSFRFEAKGLVRIIVNIGFTYVMIGKDGMLYKHNPAKNVMNYW